ncbi:MAG: helicase C-terminal domain-containing protein [Actinomycetota bacterium]
MQSKFVSHLRGLSPSDFEALLRRRPQARQLLLTTGRPDFPALAQLLARPEGVRDAVASLDEFLLQLLHLAVWLGPEVPAEQLAWHASGVSPESLRRGAEELARWGLAFPARKGGDWCIEVPDCASSWISEPAGLGPTTRRMLPNRSAEFLAAVAANIGLTWRQRPRKEAMLDLVASALGEPKRIAALLAEAPKKAVKILEKARREQGRLTWPQLVSDGHARWSDRHWSEHTKVTTDLHWLESRGLLFVDSPLATHPGAGTVVPAEVELAMRGGRIFDSWAPEPVPLLTAEVPAGAGSGDPSKVLADAEALLEEWSRSRPQPLQRGGLGVRELRRAAKASGLEERYVSFLYALLAEAGLLIYDDQKRLAPSAAAWEWVADPPPLRWAKLFTTWRNSMLWSEPENGLVRLDQVAYRPFIPILRTATLEELAGLPSGVGTEIPSLARRLSWRHPSLIHCEECAGLAIERTVEALAWLGTARGPSPIALGEPARSALSDPEWVSRSEGASSAFPADVNTCTVGADLTIIVPGLPVHDLRATLTRFADLGASSPARIYRLSETSLRRGLDSGMKAEEIVALLDRYAPKGVPQNVAYLIEDVGRRHGRLVAGRAGLYVRSEDPALLRAVTADRRLASCSPRLLSPTVAVMEGQDVEILLGTLRSAGYMPVADPGTGADTRTATASDARPIFPRPPRALSPLEPAEASRLARAILARGSPRAAPATGEDRVRPPGVGEGNLLDGRTYTNPVQIAKLLEAALEQEMVVEISYISRGKQTTRSIEPLEIEGRAVVARCRLRNDERTFHLSRISQARATGERTDEDEDEDPFEGGELVLLERRR